MPVNTNTHADSFTDARGTTERPNPSLRPTCIGNHPADVSVHCSAPRASTFRPLELAGQFRDRFELLIRQQASVVVEDTWADILPSSPRLSTLGGSSDLAIDQSRFGRDEPRNRRRSCTRSLVGVVCASQQARPARTRMALCPTPPRLPR